MEKYKARRPSHTKPIPRCQHEDKGKQCERAVYFGDRCFWHQQEAVEHFAAIGRKGGAATENKARGDSDYYQRISKQGVQARKAKRAKK